MTKTLSPLDICDSTNDNNLWFVVLLLGLCGVNCIILLGFMVHSCILRSTTCCYSWKALCSCCGAQDEENSSKGNSAWLRKIPAVPIPQVNASADANEISKGRTDEFVQEQIREINSTLKIIRRLIESKGINEVTASYALHNAHDAIGNKVPTAAQVTLEQISGFQARTAQQLVQVSNKLQQIEDDLARDRRAH